MQEVFPRIILCEDVLFRHSAHLASQGTPFLVGGDDAVYLGGGFHREDKVIPAEVCAEQILHAVGHACGEGIVYDIAVTVPCGGILSQDGEVLAHAIPHYGGVATADLAADCVGLLMAVNLAYGALFQQHEGEATVDDGTGGSGTAVFR